MSAETYSKQWKTGCSKHVDQIFIRMDVEVCRPVFLCAKPRPNTFAAVTYVGLKDFGQLEI